MRELVNQRPAVERWIVGLVDQDRGQAREVSPAVGVGQGDGHEIDRRPAVGRMVPAAKFEDFRGPCGGAVPADLFAIQRDFVRKAHG